MQNFISIPKPCNENWDAMTPQEQGRHCTKCNVAVKDFGGMSQAAIRSFFDKNTGRVCGRFNENQLYNKPRLNVQLKKFLYALAIAFLPFIPLQSIGQSLQTIKKVQTNVIGAIAGKIANTAGEPVPFVAVTIFENGIMKGYGKSDIQGNYKINRLTPGSYDLRISFVSYENVLIKDITIQAGKTFTLHPPPLRVKRNTIKIVRIKNPFPYGRQYMGICYRCDEKNDDEDKNEGIWIDAFRPNRQIITKDQLHQMGR